MKVVIVLLILLGAAIFGVYQWGGYKTLDPDQQAADAKAAITPGTNWQKVVQIAGDPKQYQVIIVEKEDEETGEPLLTKPGPRNKYSHRGLSERIADGGLPNGFIFAYQFSARSAFEVYFDGMGNVIYVQDMATMTDLLQMRED